MRKSGYLLNAAFFVRLCKYGALAAFDAGIRLRQRFFAAALFCVRCCIGPPPNADCPSEHNSVLRVFVGESLPALPLFSEKQPQRPIRLLRLL